MKIANQQQLESAMSAIYKKHGVFFAFSKKQFNEQKEEGVEYSSLGSGLIAPKESAEEFQKELIAALDNYHQTRLEVEGKDKIIMDELFNHECQIVSCYDDIIDLMGSYGITEEDILKVWPIFIKKCQDEDLF
jgi:hypothetical protein